MKENNMDNKVTIYVDGSYTTNNPDVTGWGWVAKWKGKDGYDYSHNDHGKLEGGIVSMRQIGGEIKATMEAIKWAIFNGYSQIIIKYDYEGIPKWAQGKWKAKKKWTKEYADWMLKNAYNRVEFVKVEGGDNLADEYARKTTGAPSAH